MPADDADSSAPDSLPACPGCGNPVTMTATSGPITAVVAPCGCQVAPGALESSDSE
ncbi:hypothetical protein [Natrinema salinisoli]|uniref:hypothetical protein n=1 Tax=Natrinema salinisoli TaxID=2878535 RepID=UPI001CF0A850|nr:hypothetical protein [Natrinema salinisoli]